MGWRHPHTGVVAFLAGLAAAHDWRLELGVVVVVFCAGWFAGGLVRAGRRLVRRLS